MNCLLLALCLLCHPAENPVQLRRTVDRVELPLSGQVLLELEIEGPRPLHVELPKDLLAEESETFWQVKPQGTVTVSQSGPGRETWRQRWILEPFSTGSELVVQFNPVKVWTQEEAQPREYRWQSITLKVTSSVKPNLGELRPPTDYDDGRLPTPSQSLLVPILSVIGMSLLLLGLLCRLRWRPRTVSFTAEERFLRVLDELQTAPSAEVAAQLPIALRSWLGSEFPEAQPGISNSQLVELLVAKTECQSIVTELGELLERCDLVKFAGTTLSEQDLTRLMEVIREVVQLVATRKRMAQV
jgi:hypothetical protein